LCSTDIHDRFLGVSWESSDVDWNPLDVGGELEGIAGEKWPCARRKDKKGTIMTLDKFVDGTS